MDPTACKTSPSSRAVHLQSCTPDGGTKLNRAFRRGGRDPRYPVSSGAKFSRNRSFEKRTPASRRCGYGGPKGN